MAIARRSNATITIRFQRRLGYRGSERDLSRLCLWGGTALAAIGLFALVGSLMGYV